MNILAGNHMERVADKWYLQHRAPLELVDHHNMAQLTLAVLYKTDHKENISIDLIQKQINIDSYYFFF